MCIQVFRNLSLDTFSATPSTYPPLPPHMPEDKECVLDVCARVLVCLCACKKERNLKMLKKIFKIANCWFISKKCLLTKKISTSLFLNRVLYIIIYIGYSHVVKILIQKETNINVKKKINPKNWKLFYLDTAKLEMKQYLKIWSYVRIFKYEGSKFKGVYWVYTCGTWAWGWNVCLTVNKPL